MLKLIKWLLGLVVTVTVLIVLAAVIVPNVVDPNDYREEIANLVKDKTGRELNLSGDLEVSVFPWLGVRTQGLTLSQPDGIGGHMIAVDTAQLRVKLLPLLSKNVVVDTVVLESPMIKLVTLANGTDSFAGLSNDSADEDVQEDSASAAVALAIQGVELSNGTLIIDDRQAGSLMELRNLNLETGNLIGDALADITASGELVDSASPDITQFDLKAKANINTDSLEVMVADLVGKVKQGEFDIDLSLESVSFKDLAKVVISNIELNVSGAENAKANIPKLLANLDTQTASIASLSAEYQSIKAQILDLSVIQFIDQPSATGRINVPKFDARGLVKDLELDFQPSDSQALSSFGLSAAFTASLEKASIKDLVVDLDQTNLTGSASVENFEQPRLSFDLSLTDLDLDSYLPESTEEEDEVSGGEALAVPMAAFKDVYANGTFKASKLVSGGVALTDIDVVVKSTPGNVSITPRANLYDGKLDGAIVFNESSGKSSLAVKNSIDLVQLSPLLSDAIDSDMLRGIGTLGIDLVVTEVDGKQSNRGTIELRAKDGALSGFDVNNIVGKLNSAADLYSSFKGDQQPVVDDSEVQGQRSDNTEFSELLGTFYLKDFLMTNDDLKFKGPGFEITGAGQFDLDKENMDYRVNLVIAESINGENNVGVQKILGSKLKWLAGKQIPIRCTGSFDGPMCLPDMKELYSFYLSSKLNDRLTEKLGIKSEDGKKVRTKDIFKQLLIKELVDEEPSAEGGEPSGEQALSGEAKEVPIGERDAENPDEQASDQVPPREKTKKELREERKRKLIEGLFN